jgi:hypothetical protein
MAKKKDKPVKVPRYLVAAGTKKTRVIFEDLTEGFIPTERVRIVLPRISKEDLKKLRKDYVDAAVSRVVSQYPTVTDL